jgi:hypothetical protein
MNSVWDIFLVDDRQNDMDLALYSLREEKLANIFVARSGIEPMNFFFCGGAFLGRSFNHPRKLALLDVRPTFDGPQVLKEIRERFSQTCAKSRSGSASSRNRNSEAQRLARVRI